MSTNTVPLGSLVRATRRNVTPEQIDPEGDFILLEHIAKETGEVTPGRAGEFDTKSAKAAFEEGDILYGKLRPGLRKCCVATGSGAASTDIAALRPVHSDSAYYLAAVLRSEAFTARVQRIVAGANLPRVNVKELLTLEVPWPVTEAELHHLNRTAREAIELRSEVAALLAEVALLELAVTGNA